MPLSLFRDWRRRRVLDRPFPTKWRHILTERLPFYNQLSDDEKEAFENHLVIFLREKHWVGAGGLEVTEEMKVVISAAAARIARHLPYSVYDRLAEIVVYHSDYRFPDDHRRILGTAYRFGTVVLSWDAVQEGIDVPDDGRDTAIHEFAHVLDRASGAFNGTPLLERGRDYGPWAKVMGAHFQRLQDDALYTCLRSYGAQNEAEFFAVATEAFFETPDRIRACAPDLYEVLADYFKVEPRSVEE